MSDLANEAPLVELLRIPEHLRLEYQDDGPLKAHHYIPVGEYCNRAADHIEELQARLKQVEAVPDARYVQQGWYAYWHTGSNRHD